MALRRVQDLAADGAAVVSEPLGCVEHSIPLDADGLCSECVRLTKARDQAARVLRSMEGALSGDQQEHVIECAMRLRELACYYGPYFRWAITLTSCEIAAKLLVLPDIAEFEHSGIMLPGLKSAAEVGEIEIPGQTKKPLGAAVRKLIVPGNDSKH